MEKQQIFISQWLQDEFQQRGRRESVENVRRLQREVRKKELFRNILTGSSPVLMLLGAGTLEASQAALDPVGIGLMIAGVATAAVALVSRWITGDKRRIYGSGTRNRYQHNTKEKA